MFQFYPSLRRGSCFELTNYHFVAFSIHYKFHRVMVSLRSQLTVLYVALYIYVVN